MNEISRRGAGNQQSPRMRGHEIWRYFGGGRRRHSPGVPTGRAASPQRPVVVVSALAKVTDQLMDSGWAAAERRLDSARETLQLLRQRHETVASGLVADGDDDCARLAMSWPREFESLEKSGERHRLPRKLSRPQSQDRLLGVGEALSSRLVHARCDRPEQMPCWWMRSSASLPTPRTPGPRRFGKRPTSACKRYWSRC